MSLHPLPGLTAAGFALAGAAALWAGWRGRRLGELRAQVRRLRAELEEARDHSARTDREVRALHALTTRIAEGGAASEPALAALVSIVARSFEADLVAVLLLDETAGELVVQPGAFGLSGPEGFYRLPLDREAASSVRVFRTRRPFLTADAQSDPGVISSYARLWGVRSLMVLPVQLEGKPIGVLRVGSFRPGRFGAEDLELLGVIADEAAVIVETAVLNRRLTQTTEQLRAASRMKDEFVSMVSHEFKTPLTTILGFSNLLLEGKGGPVTGEQARALGLVRGAARRLSTMVGELLDLARLESARVLEAGPVDLGALLAECAEGHLPRAQEGGRRLELDLPEGLPPALGDGKWLRLVFDNLISNAVKFTRPGGRIRVWAADKAEGVLAGVDDDGVGIPAEEREKVFERFYRGSGAAALSAPGTGLGLAIAREIVARHGGRVWCEAGPGGGTRFLVALPCASREEVSSP